MFNNNQVLGALQKNTFRTLSSCDHKIFCSWKMVTDKRLVGCWYRYWHYWVGLSINSLASIAIFFTLTKIGCKWAAREKICRLDVTFPFSRRRNFIHARRSSVASHQPAIHLSWKKYFGLSPDFSFQNVFQKVCQLPRGSQESQRGEKWRRQLSILAILSTLEISVTWIILAALVNIGHTNLWPNCSTHFDLPNQQILGRFLID